jgi:hypothetical protein
VAYVAYIVYLSVKTFIAAGELAGSAAANAHHSARLVTAGHLRLLAGTEVVAALAFLNASAELYAGCVLLAIYAIAFTLDTLGGRFPVHLLFYAATVLLFLGMRATSMRGTKASD